MAQEAPTPAAPPQKSRKLLIVAASVLVLGGIGGGFWYARHGSNQQPAEAPKEPPAIVNMDPFVVNLSDPGGARFLRVTMGLVVSGEDEAKDFAENPVERMRVRSAVLEFLSQQTAVQLTKPEGKAELKKAIAARSSE